MNRITRIAFASAAALALAACGTTAQTEMTRYNNWMPDLPQTLVADCPVAPPPDQKTYVASTWQKKEDLLSTAYSSQTLNIGNCNIDKAKLRAWWSQQKAIVDQANAANVLATATAPAAASASATQATK